MRKINISNSVGLGLIIHYPSGIRVTSQTGGTACLLMSLEGIYVPLFNDYEIPSKKFISRETELSDYFTSKKYAGTGAINGIDLYDVQIIESILHQDSITFIKVDREKILESHEAWIWVQIEEDSTFFNFPSNEFPMIGVLTWSNSD